jgi:gamma-glutamyl phosphate reductase
MKVVICKEIERGACSAVDAPAVSKDDAVTGALSGASAFLRERRADLLAANRDDVETTAGTLDEGSIDRLHVDDTRPDAPKRDLLATTALELIDREIGERALPNGLVVSERRISIVVGARPNVALGVAGQLLKSLDGAVLRTGAAALCTVAVRVGEVPRPALERAGPGGVAFAEGIASVPDAELSGRPHGVEAVYRSRLVVLRL